MSGQQSNNVSFSRVDKVDILDGLHTCYFFTFNNPIKKGWTADRVKALFGALNIDKYAFQLESGEKCGTPHFQGCIRFRCKQTAKLVPFKTFTQVGRDGKAKPIANWSICRDFDHCLRYCTKLNTRLEGPWCKEFTPVVDTKEPKAIEPMLFRANASYEPHYRLPLCVALGCDSTECLPGSKWCYKCR